MSDEKIIEYILKNGKAYIPALLPEELSYGEVGQCFDVAILAAIKNPKYKYVEGIAIDPVTKIWLVHAWVTDGVHAFDLTWRAKKQGKDIPFPSKYIGIEMDTKMVAYFMLKTEYCGVLKNSFRNRELADLLLPGFLTK